MTEKILPVSFSARALEEIKNIIRSKNIPDEYGLRIGVAGAGCAGVSYQLGFDKKKENDDVYKIEDLDVYIQKKALLYLAGQKIEYHEGDAKGFFFVPENEGDSNGTSEP